MFGLKPNVRLAIIPGIDARHLLSIDAVLQIIEMISCLSGYLSLHLSMQCTYVDTLRPGRDDTILAQLCTGPNVHVTRMTSLVYLFSITGSLILFGLQLTRVRTNAWTAWGNYLVLFQLASCALLTLISSSFLAADAYQTKITMSAFSLGFVASMAYAANFIWEFYKMKTKL